MPQLRIAYAERFESVVEGRTHPNVLDAQFNQRLVTLGKVSLAHEERLLDDMIAILDASEASFADLEPEQYFLDFENTPDQAPPVLRV